MFVFFLSWLLFTRQLALNYQSLLTLAAWLGARETAIYILSIVLEKKDGPPKAAMWWRFTVGRKAEDAGRHTFNGGIMKQTGLAGWPIKWHRVGWGDGQKDTRVGGPRSWSTTYGQA